MNQSVPVITIDGPAASGKGTIALGVAMRLAYHYLDSGALYRLVALAATWAGVSPDSGPELGAIAARLPADFKSGRPSLAGRDVAEEIRSEAISSAASRVAVQPAVRAALLERQRAFRRAPGLVAEGRDMGTVVFPDATLKIFLTASPEVRADRRYKQLSEKGLSATIATLLQEIRERDARDQSRAIAPLQPATDALMLDTTDLSVEQATERVLSLWSSRS